MVMIKKLLIANRGEIACRILRSAQRLGISTVAVYSDADIHAQHVTLADEAIRLGSAPATESYLHTERLIAAAHRTGADAIHPGYGFLSENADFAGACEDAVLNFVGPSSQAIRTMGAKSEAKKIMAKAGVVLIPGYHGDEQSDERLLQEAQTIGYPVLIKASAGGGGRGMRIVESCEQFTKELTSARRESASAFGNDHVLLERYLRAPRHIEVQIFGDHQGNYVHLFERDCSVQRRHQKIIEEAPAPGMNEEIRQGICQSAIAAARAIDYIGAGTVEFLLDSSGEHYFMEMNTRLQVEHPVTEFITGFDLVEWQLLIASGESLPATQETIQINGHSVEARLCAENPERNFMPSTGRIQHLRFPGNDSTLRIDTGVRTGDEVSFYYDPMVAKVIAWGQDRAQASRRLADALDGIEVVGIITNASYLARLCRHDAFLKGEVHTGFIEEHGEGLKPPSASVDPNALAIAAISILKRQHQSREASPIVSADPRSPWYQTDNWRLNTTGYQSFKFRVDKQDYPVKVMRHIFDQYTLIIDEKTVGISGEYVGDNEWRVTVDGMQTRATVVRAKETLIVFYRAQRHDITHVDPLIEEGDVGLDSGRLTAPLPGKIISIAVQPGEKVSRGTTLLVLEAMKMEHNIVASSSGTVAEVRYQVGDLVDEEAELIVLENG